MCLTNFQLNLTIYTRIFKNIFEMNEDIPEKIKQDPEAFQISLIHQKQEDAWKINFWIKTSYCRSNKRRHGELGLQTNTEKLIRRSQKERWIFIDERLNGFEWRLVFKCIVLQRVMETIKIRYLYPAEDSNVTENSYLALDLNENDKKIIRRIKSRITVKATVSQISKSIFGGSPPLREDQMAVLKLALGILF